MKVQNLTTLVAKNTNKKGWAFFGEWRVPKNHRCRGVLFSGSVQDSHNNFVNLQPIVWLKFCKTMKIRLFTIPNLLTLSNLLCGALAVVATLVHGNLTLAFWLIAAAAVCDFFDGMVARALGISGPMGIQLDSLADDISFGLAPATILFLLFGRVNGGVLPEWMGYTVFLFSAFAALRLAKFNIDEAQHTEFRGLPTPAATLFVVSLGWSIEHAGICANLQAWGVLIAAWVFALLMICNVPMFSLKFAGFGWRGNEVRYLFLVVSVALLLLFSVEAFLLIIPAYVVVSSVLAVIKGSKS